MACPRIVAGQAVSAIFLRHQLLPSRIRVGKHIRIVEMLIARDLRPQEVGLLKCLGLASEFHFSHHEPVVGTMKLIDLKRVDVPPFTLSM